MKTLVSVMAVAVAGAMLWGGTALGQGAAKKGCEALKAGSPAKVEGQVVSVDQNQNKVTVRGPDGKAHEFQASRETIRDFKVGDRIEAQLRDATNC